jgi:type III secretory pathway lipoprotein EscJ
MNTASLIRKKTLVMQFLYLFQVRFFGMSFLEGLIWNVFHLGSLRESRSVRGIHKALLRACSDRSRLFVCSFLVLTLAACKKEVLHDLNEPQANTIVARLHTVDIEAQKARQPDGNWSIVVQGKQFQEALLFLTRARLVQSTPSSSEEVEGGLFPKNSRGTLSYQKWLGVEIRETLRSFPGVLDAKVHLYLPKQESLFERHQSSKGTGSVLLIVSTDAHIVNEEIAQLVAGAAGLQHQDISVLQTVEADSGLLLQKGEVKKQVEHLGTKSFDPFSTQMPWKVLLCTSAFLLLFGGIVLIYPSFRRRTYQGMSQKSI